jgi:hypothetical protein
MAQLDEALLERRMTKVERARAWSPRVISKLEGLLPSDDEAGLHRVNPLAFARERGVIESEAIDLSLHAARAGLFQMGWDVLCPILEWCSTASRRCARSSRASLAVYATSKAKRISTISSR